MEKLNGKDLINVGIYSAIYFVIMMIVAMLGSYSRTIPNVGYICADYWGNPVYALFNESEKIRYDLDYEYFNGCTDDCMRYGILCSYCGNCYRSAG